jgi:diaminopimelate epimerase
LLYTLLIMLFKFSKMHGLGNDFVVIDAVTQSVHLSSEDIQFVANRRLGIGCDQVLLVEPSVNKDADFCYRIFNADGEEVAQCGNGARCLARFVHDKNLTDKRQISVETNSGIIYLSLQDQGNVTVNMGMPQFDPKDIPLLAEHAADVYPIQVGDRYFEIGAVSMGNPHAVLEVEDVDQAPVKSLGALIESHPRFPERVNVGFMQIVDGGHIKLRVFERGVGETSACGTGACAAVVIGHQRKLLTTQVKVDLPGGQLLINWAGGDSPVLMSGPAEHVFEGQIKL